MASIYLDYNSTTPLLPEVAAAMAEAQLLAPGNPESQHFFGRQARRILEEARDGLGALLGADLTGRRPDRVMFTSGGTESNNWALIGMSGDLSSGPRAPGRIAISAIEHPSVARPADLLAKRGWRVDRVGPAADGVVRTDRFAELAEERPALASVMLANNETGVVQPVRQLATLARAAGVPLHTDATQAVGKIPVHFRELGVAALTCAAHKFHGPHGVGVLIVRGDVAIESLLAGGFQQESLRPGTENVALAVGMRTALEIAIREQAERHERMKSLRDRLERALGVVWPVAVVVGAAAERLPNTACIAFPGIDRQALVMALDLAGVCCSTGSACASGSSEPSPTLVAMGLSDDIVSSSLRFSLGATTTAEEIDDAIVRVSAVLGQWRLHPK